MVVLMFFAQFGQHHSGKLLVIRAARAGDPAPGPPDCLRSGLVGLRFGIDLASSVPDFHPIGI